MIHYKGSGHLHIEAYGYHIDCMDSKTVDNFIINCCTLLNNTYCLEWNFDNKHNDFIECGTISYITLTDPQKLFSFYFKDFNILRSNITKTRTIYLITPKTILGYWLYVNFLSYLIKIDNERYSFLQFSLVP